MNTIKVTFLIYVIFSLTSCATQKFVDNFVPSHEFLQVIYEEEVAQCNCTPFLVNQTRNLELYNQDTNMIAILGEKRFLELYASFLSRNASRHNFLWTNLKDSLSSDEIMIISNYGYHSKSKHFYVEKLVFNNTFFSRGNINLYKVRLNQRRLKIMKKYTTEVLKS
jgi:hypothetical protein